MKKIYKNFALNKVFFILMLVVLFSTLTLSAKSFPLIDRLFNKPEQKEEQVIQRPQNDFLKKEILDLNLKNENSDLKNPPEQKCKNFVDCNYQNGFYCLGKSVLDEIGQCTFICVGAKPSLGLNTAGESLGCPSFHVSSGKKDLSGRNICCPDIDAYNRDNLKQVDISKIRGCKKSSDCYEGEFCTFLDTNKAWCAKYNTINTKIIKGSCPIGASILAVGPEGNLCYNPTVDLSGAKLSPTRSAIDSEGEDEDHPFKALVKKKLEEEKQASKEDVKSETKNLKTNKTSKKDYSIGLIIHTPDLFYPNVITGYGTDDVPKSDLLDVDESENVTEEASKEEDVTLPKADKISSVGLEEEMKEAGLQPGSTLTKNTNIKKSITLKKNTNIKSVDLSHSLSYKEGEEISFSVFVVGPPKSLPKDIKSYGLNILAKENKSKDPGKDKNLIELKTKEVFSTVDFKNLVRSAPPLNLCLINEDDKGKYEAALGSEFNLTIPYFTYLNRSNSEGLKMYESKFSTQGNIPENKCSAKGGAICGTNSLDVGNCITYGCWKYTKSTPLAKKCCEGELPQDVTNDIKIEIDKKEKNEKDYSKPQCDKKSNEIICSTANEINVPHCGEGLVPDCSKEKKPICKRLVDAPSTLVPEISEDEMTEAETVEKNKGPLYELSQTKPKCISYAESVDLFCKDVASLEYNKKYEVSRCVADYCDYLKSPEKKMGCCTGCKAIYNKLTTDYENIDYYEEKKMKSCIDFDGGHCGNFSHIESCINNKCYEQLKDQHEYVACCISNDKEALNKEEFINKSKTVSEKGSTYTVLSAGNGSVKRVKKAEEVLLLQSFVMKLPMGTKTDKVSIVAAIKDKNNKYISKEVKINLVQNDENKKEKEDEKEKDKCAKSVISSANIANEEEVSLDVDESVEYTFTVQDDKSQIEVFKIEGLPKGLSYRMINDSEQYKLVQIVGKADDSGIHKVKITAINACKESSEFLFTIKLPMEPVESSASNSDDKNSKLIDKKLSEKLSKDILISYTPKFEKLLTEILAKDGKVLDIKGVKSGNILISGSKASIVAELKEGIESINPASVDIVLEGSSGLQFLPSIPEILPGNKVKLEVIAQGQLENNCKVRLKAKDTGEILAATNVFVYKPGKVTSIDEKTIFGKPLIERQLISLDENKKIQLKLYGKNFIGEEAIINGKKASIPPNNSLNLSSFSVVEFRNKDIDVNRSDVSENFDKIDLNLTLPKDYAGGKEQVILSTPAGQTAFEINLPSMFEPKVEKQNNKVDEEKIDSALIKSIFKLFRKK